MINIYDQSVPDELTLTKVDIAELYGVAVTSVPWMYRHGRIPAPADRQGRYHTSRWFVGQLRRAMKEDYKRFLRVKKPLRAD